MDTDDRAESDETDQPEPSDATDQPDASDVAGSAGDPLPGGAVSGDPVSGDASAVGSEPPDDAEDWTDEQWLEWLSSTDPEAPVGSEKPSIPSRITKSAVGSVMGNAMLGLDFAIYGRRENEMVVIAAVTGDHDDDEVDIQLDPEDPSKSTVQVHHDQP